MNREIKFRAWSHEGKKMQDWFFIKSVNNLIKLLSLSHIVVMQFTGLKDQQGIEIYEGDVVKHLHSDGNCIVEFEKETAMFLAREVGGDMLGFGIENVTQVIGNIYQNTVTNLTQTP